VPFRMRGVTKRGWPAPPAVSDFSEINVRTYVTAGGKRGVWFFSLDAASFLAVRFARLFFHLPYYRARIRASPMGDRYAYHSVRGDREFAATFEVGVATPSRPGSFAEWATERYCLYSANRRGRCFRAEIQHGKWPLRRAEVALTTNRLADVELGSIHPEKYFSARLDVVLWPLGPID